MDNQEESPVASSSSSAKIGEIENKLVEINLKEGSKSDVENQVEMEFSIKELPSEAKSEETKTELDESVVEKAFRIDLISKNILNCLGVNDLKNCRLVSLYWKEVSTAILQNRQDAQIKFQISCEGEMFYYTTVKSTESKYERKLLLKDLTALLTSEASKNFPFTSFCFNRGDLASAEMRKFLFEYGSKIKFAALEFHESSTPLVSTSIQAFREFLLDGAPNIEHLSLGNLPEVWNSLGENGKLFPHEMLSRPSLPLLKTLEIQHGIKEPVHLQILKDVLSIAPNLKKILGFQPEFARGIIETGKVLCVHDANVSVLAPSLTCPVKEFAELAEAKPQLKVLTIGLGIVSYYRKNKKAEEAEMKEHQELFKDVVNKLLFSSQSSLQNLTLRPIGVLGTTLKEIQIPVLENLKILNLHYANNFMDFVRGGGFFDKAMEPGNEQEELIFPVGVTNLREIFPAVQALSLTLYTDKDELFSVHFPGDPEDFCIPSVKKLKLSKKCTSLWLKKLSVMFPNVQLLEMTIDFEADDPPEEIWTLWPKLENLEFSRSSKFYNFSSEEKVVKNWKNPNGEPRTIVEWVDPQPVRNFAYFISQLELSSSVDSSDESIDFEWPE